MLDESIKEKLKKMKLVLDVAAKLIALGSVCCMIIGAFVIWLYLDNAGIGFEITSAISSPQVLLVMAIASIIISACFACAFIIFPGIIKSFEGDEYNWNSDSKTDSANGLTIFKYVYIKNNNTVNILFFTVFTFSALMCIICATNIHAMYIFYIIVFLILPIGMTVSYHKHKGGSHYDNLLNKVVNSIVLFCMMSLTCAILILALFFVFQTTYLYVSHNNITVICALIIFSIIYSFTSAYAIVSNKYNAILPVLFVAIFIVVPLVINDGASKIVSKLGLGGFYESIALKEKQARLFNKVDGYKISNVQDDDIKLIDNIWVNLKLPNKLVVSSGKETKHFITIPTTALLAETSMSNKLSKK